GSSWDDSAVNDCLEARSRVRMRTSPWSLHSRPPNRYFRLPLRSPTPLPQAHRRARRRAPGPQLPGGVGRAHGWPQAGTGLSAGHRRMPGCRLAAGTYRSGEVRGITAGRSRRADFAGEECWFRGRELLVSRAATNIHLPQNRADAHTPALRSTSHPKTLGGTLPRNRTALSARVLV